MVSAGVLLDRYVHMRTVPASASTQIGSGLLGQEVPNAYDDVPFASSVQLPVALKYQFWDSAVLYSLASLHTFQFPC
jgi:hypothetical protein